MEARGFGMGTAPTSFIEYRAHRRDYAAFATLVTIGAGYFVIYYTGYGVISAK